MGETQLKRPQYGTFAERNLATEAEDDGGYTRKVRRDRTGRVVAVEGPGKVDSDIAQIREAVERLEGWMPGPGGTRVNARNAQALSWQFGVRRPVTISWMSNDDGRKRGCDGYLTPTKEGNHDIVLRAGLPTSQIAENLTHELAHASQLEHFGYDKFLQLYREQREALERDARETAAKFANQYELVRRDTDTL